MAAVAGIALGWAVCEITRFGLWNATTTLGEDLTIGAYVGAVGFFFAVVYYGWEDIIARSWEGIKLAILRAGLLGFVLAFGAGVAAEIAYRHFITQILRDLTFSDLVNIQSNTKLYLVRALAWAMFGVGMGVAVAGSFNARDRLVNGIVGGAVGGALGGLVFHWASFNIHSETSARLVGLVVVGLAIGLAIGLVEKVRREAWIKITTGAMAGKEFIVYGSTCTVGSSPRCDITLIKDPSIQPFHAVISTSDGSGANRRLLDAYEGCTVAINGMPAGHHRLRSGDIIGIGGMSIAYLERAAVS